MVLHMDQNLFCNEIKYFFWISYKNSTIPENLSFISLCEVVPNESFKKFTNAFTTGIATLQDEKACIVRFVFPVSKSFSFAPNQNLKVPTLSEILQYQVENYSSK